MHKCNKCGREFDGNFCPNCDTGVNERKITGNFLSKPRVNIKKIILITVPILIVAIIAIILISLNAKSCSKNMTSSVQKIEMGDTASEVEKILGTPDDKDTYIYQYYGGEYKSLLKKQQQLENKLMSVGSFNDLENITNELLKIEEQMSKLEYPYTEIIFNEDKKVYTVIYDAKRTADLSNSGKTVKTAKLFPQIISPLTDPYTINFTAKEIYYDGSYYYGSVLIDKSEIDTFKSGYQNANWKAHFGKTDGRYCSEQIEVGNKVSAGTQISGELGRNTFKATVKDECTLDKLYLDVTIEGDSQSLTYNEESDTYWTKIRPYITKLTLPDSITSIGENIFNNCKALSTINYKGDIKSWCEISGVKNLPSANRTLNVDSKEIAGKLIISDGVQNINDYAFAYCNKLTSVTIPDSVTSIGEDAFYGCNIETATIPTIACSSIKNAKLKTVTITSGESICEGAFYGCNELTNITIPDSVTSIGHMAFSGCNGLTSVVVGENNANYKSINNCILTKDGKTLILGCKSSIIPDGVTNINANAFYGCSGLTSIVIPDSITNINAAAFYGCSGLEEIIVNTNNEIYKNENNCILSKEGKTLVLGCKNSIIPDSVTSIGNYAFSGCSGLTSITIPDSVTGIGEDAFIGCSGLTSVTIPDSVTRIGSLAFYGCSGLTSIKIGNGVKNIGDYTFKNCPIETATIPAIACDEIKNSALKTVIITSGRVIGYTAFKDCYSLTCITIPNSVTSIGREAFDGCRGLTSINIPDSVTSIGEDAFYNCKGLTSITIPDSVTSIGYRAFSYCSGLTKIEVGTNNEKYKSVNNCLLSKDGATLILCCKTSIIPNSVTSIGNYAFSGCDSLTSITIPNSVTSIGSEAFYGCKGLTSITIPDSVTYIGSSAFSYCSSLTSVTIPDSVTTISSTVFNHCSELTSITYGGTMAQWNAISKSSSWNSNTKNYTVTCTDGKLDENGNVIA